MSNELLLLIIKILGGGGLITALYMLLKWRVEAGQTVVITTEKALLVTGGVMEKLEREMKRQDEEISQLKMENASRDQELDNCREVTAGLREEIRQFQTSMRFLQLDLDRHAKVSDLARRRAHVATHAITGYEVLIGDLIQAMRDNQMVVPRELRPDHLREAYYQEMKKIDELEAAVIQRTIQMPSPAEDSPS